MNRKRLVVILEEHIHIYDISNMKILHTIDTSPNPNALCALSPSSDNCYVAYPANNTTGEVLIFDALSLQTVNIIQAHKSPVACLSFNYDGTMLATASDKVIHYASTVFHNNPLGNCRACVLCARVRATISIQAWNYSSKDLFNNIQSPIEYDCTDVCL